MTDDVLETLPPRQEVCDLHGAYESRHFIGGVWSRCPMCAQAQEADIKRQEEIRRKRDADMRWRQSVSLAEIPERFRGCTLQNYRVTNPGQQRALDFATEYVTNFAEARKVGRCALFIGNTGTGKNHLAAAIADAIMRDGYTALLTTVMRAVRRIKESWRSRSHESESQAIAALVYPDLLILDEVGVQFGSETEQNLLFDVINERYEAYKPMLMISNLPLGEVTRYLGDRIYSRLRDGGGKYIPFDWEDYRKGGA